MFRVAFQRRFGKGSLFVLALVLVVLAGSVSAARPHAVFAATTDTCGYNPLASPSPGGGTVVFNENTITRAIAFYGVGLGGHVGVFTNDESGLLIGSGGTPSSAVPGQVYGEAKPPVFGTGSDVDGRRFAPTIYLTDITGNANATGGDWQHGGQPATTGASALYGSWSPTLGTKPVNKNNWVLGPDADPIPATDAFGGNTTSFNEGYGSEVAWNVPGLVAYDPATGTFVAVQPGHTYRAQSLTHDTDQNKGNGDVGEVCTTFTIPVANLTITKTADAASVNAGEQVGFTVEIKNTGNADATGASLNDALPAGSGSGVTWAVDNSVGTPAKFVLSGSKGSQTLALASSTIPVGADYTVHITASTSATECGTYDNTATLTSSDSSPPPASASEACKPASIHIVKTADAAQVNAGDPIGFTLTVYNSGTGDAKGVSLSDVLPVKAGLSWTIAGQGAGWAGTCAINAGTLNCGPKTVPAGTTQAASTFTVHITSPTTAATGGVCPGGSGKVDNSGNVTTTNDGSDQSSASTCVAAPDIKIVKTPDAAQVNAGDPIGFTLTVYNPGSGDANGATLSDPLPTNAGLSWHIASQGTGWAGTCSITLGTLNCGPVIVPGGTTQAASTFTVHITSPTTAATGGVCPGGSGVVDNTGTVTITNGGSDQSDASTCVAAPTIKIVKTADAAQVSAGDSIGFTLTVYNTGTGDAKGVNLSDLLPTNPGLSWHLASQGAGWGGSCGITAGTLTCGPVTVPAGTTQGGSTFTVHITSPTTAATSGDCPNTGFVDNTGSVTTTNDGSGQSSASVCVAAPLIQIVKTADAVQVNAGEQIGFTVTVYNNGPGDAKGVILSDQLPTNPGLAWQIASQGTGWSGSCSIAAGTLTCGPATVPAGTTQAASTFKVHITSTTTTATGGSCPGGSGVVNNTGSVTTTNDGSGQSSASTCVAAPSIQIVKAADAAQVMAGDQIGFTVTVYNTGTGDAHGVILSDTLPVKPGLLWQIASQGVGWGGTCAIGAGPTLTCGPATVPAGTTQAGSSFTVHITSPTTALTGGICPGGSGVVDNTGSVTTTNDGSGQSSASTCVQGLTDLQITKSGSPASQTVTQQPYGNITWTIVVKNNGPLADTHVTVGDPMPAGNTYVSSFTPKGSCLGGAILSCDLGTLQAGESVTIILVTTPTVTGPQTNIARVAGELQETDYTNNEASATVMVVGVFKPPVCTRVIIREKQFQKGRTTKVHIQVIKGNQLMKGVRVRITGPGVFITTKPSNAHGGIVQQITWRKYGIVTFRPMVAFACSAQRGIVKPPPPPTG